MKSHLYSRDLLADEFSEMWDSLRTPQDAWIWLQWDRPQPLPQWEHSGFLGKLAALMEDHQKSQADSNPLETSCQGRIFWSEGELRWRAMYLPVVGLRYRVVYLGEVPPPVDLLTDASDQFAEERVITPPTPGPWIDLQGGDVFDGSLPVTNDKQRLGIRLAEYRNNQGIVAFERMMALGYLEN